MSLQVFRANYDQYHTVARRILPTISARFVRILPKTWNSYVALRFELYGCHLGKRSRQCSTALGLQNKRIKNNLITASSKKNVHFAPFLARLHNRRAGRYYGVWMPKHNNHNQWLQVNLGRTMKVTGMSMQGRPDQRKWVKYFYIKYSTDGVFFSYLRQWRGSYLVRQIANRRISGYSSLCRVYYTSTEKFIIDSIV